jgi:hypothetical protein
VQVDCKNIDIWKQHPTAVFDVAWVPGRFSIRARWLLTSWNLPEVSKGDLPKGAA